MIGSNPSLGAGAVITSICWPFLTSYVDNLYLIEKDIQSMYEKFLRTHVVARSVNAVFKISDPVLLVSAEDGEFSILGYLVSEKKKKNGTTATVSSFRRKINFLNWIL